MNRTDDISASLRSLDPADDHVDPTSARARADLQAIIATDPAMDSAGSPRTIPAGRPRSAIRRVVLGGGMAVAVAAAMVAVPSLSGGDRAFATWTAVPGEMPAQQRPEAAADCRESLQDGPGAEYREYLGNAEVAIAETRGVWTTVMLAGPDGFSALCITDDSAGVFSEGMIGSIGVPSGGGTPEPGDVFATDLGRGTMNGRDISMAAGQVGSDVAGLVYRSRTHGDVAATVSHGRFALWMPGSELEDASTNGVEVEVTYLDGTTATSTLTLD